MNLNKNDKTLTSMMRHLFKAGLTLDEVRILLTKRGYRSASGLVLTDSHISNFYRSNLNLRKVAEYEKPNYAGRNWLIERHMPRPRTRRVTKDLYPNGNWI